MPIPPSEAVARTIADYGLIGNGRTAALVRNTGALEWLCWPRFDSDACFAALLGAERHGHWTIAPAVPCRVTRRYRDGTLVLDTTFETDTGRVTLTDFMPMAGNPAVVRILSCSRGHMPIRADFAPRFDNGKTTPTILRAGSTLVARTAGLELVLQCSRPDFLEEHGRFQMSAGQEVAYVLSAQALPGITGDVQRVLRETEEYWRQWCAKCTYDGPWRDTVVRSLITLKALIYAPTGGIVAAPTTSLPELYGGSRNWDYRFCWLRDSTFTVLALLHAGYRDEARQWVSWLLGAIGPRSDNVQPVYGIRGNADLPEYEASWLPGFRGSCPVRFGNAAYLQFQLDVYGEIQDTLHQWRALGGTAVQSSWGKQCELMARLETMWQEPDAGFWEQRSDPQKFTQSRALAWVAVDRAIQSVEQFGFDGPVERWKALRKTIHEEVCGKGFSSRLNSFTRFYGPETVDASLLLLPIVGFLPPDEPRMVGTVDAIKNHLMRDGFVYRYDQTREDDGIREHEATFLPCCFWYADNLILQGRRDEAAALFEKYLGAGNDLGLFPEEFDVSSKTLLGNFPQALTHLAIVHTACNLGGTGPAHSRSGQDAA
jgi:GH15 family glucan-1,4-alpha-glucosidase